MLRIRLSRTGKKRQPSYRVVVAEKEAKRDGRVVERIGHYNPLTNPAEYQIDEARALYWLSVGAQPSDAVRVLLNKQGTLDRLSRYHGGESLDSLVTEFTGVAPKVATPAVEVVAVQESEPSIVERTLDAAEAAAATVTGSVDAVVEKVENVTSDVIERLEDAIDAMLDTDEEE